MKEISHLCLSDTCLSFWFFFVTIIYYYPKKFSVIKSQTGEEIFFSRLYVYMLLFFQKRQNSLWEIFFFLVESVVAIRIDKKFTA